MTETKKKTSDVEIILIGSQYGGAHGEKRTVDQETAANMVAVGTARYPE